MINVHLFFPLFFILYRQEHSETQMLRKKAKDLDAEYKQLQLEYQEKENRMIALDNEVEVSNLVYTVDLFRVFFSYDGLIGLFVFDFLC